MRIIVLTDVHANLPALQAALKEIRKSGYDVIVHTGDAMGIGPYPVECLEVLMSTPKRHVAGSPFCDVVERSVVLARALFAA